jgi:hypothetical protein
MKLHILIVALLAALLLVGCSTSSRLRSSLGTKFRYTYFLSSPNPSGKLSYRDDRIKILFRIDAGAIRFKLDNLTSSLLTVKWSGAALGVLGRSHPVHSIRSYYSQEKAGEASTVILPKGYAIEMAVPAMSVYYDGSKWQEKDLLPTTDRNSEAVRKRILANKGGIVELLLPMQFEGSETINYTFRFKVSSVDEIPWEQYRKPWRPMPPKLLTSSSFTTSDQILTGAIIVGVVGIGAVLLSQKKTPPVE